MASLSASSTSSKVHPSILCSPKFVAAFAAFPALLKPGLLLKMTATYVGCQNSDPIVIGGPDPSASALVLNQNWSADSACERCAEAARRTEAARSLDDDTVASMLTSTCSVSKA